MPILKSILGILNFLEASVSAVLLVLIYKYIKRKSPGLLTVLDLLSLDCIRIWIVYIILANSIIHSGLIYGQFPFITAQVLVFASVNNLVLLLSAIQVTIVVKALLIFKGQWLFDVPDERILLVSRCVAILYTICRFLVDFAGEPKSLPFIYILTSTDEKTSLGIGPAFLVTMACLMVSLVLFKIKTLTLTDDHQEVLKCSTKIAFIGCLVFFASAFIVVNSVQLVDQIDIFLVIWISFWFILGVILPGNFILGLSNLKQFVLNVFDQYFISPIRQFFTLVSKSITSIQNPKVYTTTE